MIEKPADKDPRTFLITHSEYGTMLAAWIDDAGCFAAVGFSLIAGSPFQMVAIREDQIERVTWLQVAP